LKANAVTSHRFDVDSQLPLARKLLHEAQADIAERVARNVLFHAAP